MTRRDVATTSRFLDGRWILCRDGPRPDAADDEKAYEVTTTDELGTTEVPLPPYPMRAIPLSSNVELRYEVAAGRILATIAGLARTYRAGEIFIVPPGVVHALEAADDEPPRLLRHLAVVTPTPATGSGEAVPAHPQGGSQP